MNGALTWTLCPNLARVPSPPLDRAENLLVTSNRGEKRTAELDQSKCPGSTFFRFTDCHNIKGPYREFISAVKSQLAVEGGDGVRARYVISIIGLKF